MNKKDFFEDLQLLSLVLSEEVGELVKAINNYVWKKGTLEEIYEKCFSIHLIFFRWIAGINIFWKKKY